MDRERRLYKLDNGFLNLLFKLYNVQTAEDVLQQTPNFLENYIYTLFEIKTVEYPELVKRFGMIIPNIVPRRYFQFINDNIIMYKDISNRIAINTDEYIEDVPFDDFVNMLKSYTDDQVIDGFQYTGPFFGRLNLLFLIHNNLYNNTFQLYNGLDSQIRKRILDTHTEIGIPINDLSLPLLTFGDYHNLTLLSVADLNKTFHRDSTNRFLFRAPGSNLVFSKLKIYQLLSLLPFMKQTDDVISFYIKTKFMLIGEENRETFIGARRVLANDLPDNYSRSTELSGSSSEVTPIKYNEIFTYIFEAGQYMIGWKGPGAIYITNRPNVNVRPDPTAILLLAKARDLLPDNFCLTGLQFDEISGNLRQSDLLVVLLDNLLDNNFCYQYNVLTLLDTGWFYKYVIDNPVDMYDPIPLWPIT